MKYMGSKSRIAKYIVPIIQKYIDENRITTYFEPFVGGANVIDKIDCDKLKHSMNSLLPGDIYVKEIIPVSDTFHARYHVKAKEYIYRINLGEYDPIERNYVYQYNRRYSFLYFIINKCFLWLAK